MTRDAGLKWIFDAITPLNTAVFFASPYKAGTKKSRIVAIAPHVPRFGPGDFRMTTRRIPNRKPSQQHLIEQGKNRVFAPMPSPVSKPQSP